MSQVRVRPPNEAPEDGRITQVSITLYITISFVHQTTLHVFRVPISKCVLFCIIFSMMHTPWYIVTSSLVKNDMSIFTARIRRMGKVIFSLCVSVHTSTGGGGTQSQVQVGGVPGPGRGVPGPGSGGGVPGPGQGGTWSQIGGGPQSQVQWGVPVSVKGKIFDTRFGLIHVQTGKKFFCQGTPPQ